MGDLNDFGGAEANSTKSKLGLFAFGVVTTSVVGLTLGVTPFVLPALRKVCLPYVPATDAQVENIFKVLSKSKGRQKTLVDIGSGDGRIVIEAAKKGYQATGYELNSSLVFYSKVQAWRKGCYKTATFKHQDLWKANFDSFDDIVIFGVEEMMGQLGEKLQTEMKKDANIVACRFPFPKWTPVKELGDGIDTVWLYKKSDR